MDSSIWGIISIVVLACGLYGLHGFTVLKKGGMPNLSMLMGQEYEKAKPEVREEFSSEIGADSAALFSFMYSLRSSGLCALLCIQHAFGGYSCKYVVYCSAHCVCDIHIKNAEEIFLKELNCRKTAAPVLDEAGEWDKLIEAAFHARENSYSPYSKFRVARRFSVKVVKYIPGVM